MSSGAAMILAGGMARRMQGADKAFLPLGDQTLFEHVLSRVAPQCRLILISANGPPARYAAFGLPIIADQQAISLGPLAGILAGLDYLAQHAPTVTHLVSLPVDTPFIPTDLIARLEEAGGLVSAASGGQVHHAVTLWPQTMREALRHQLIDQGNRSVRDFLAGHGATNVEWPITDHDPFFNINNVEELVLAEAWVAPAPPARH
ncbi:MAG: molybdenum cofactor guanylyltransferase MobA [Hyphomicrobiales bacterium]|nr:molybdenum cofactor guanylyltransferase MobA [Hyphomicrobiales bacterium]MDE2115209.1 molybdenum cofactor guanylyltransferase MobA [Hyphomicrobiales bacterium]